MSGEKPGNRKTGMFLPDAEERQQNTASSKLRAKKRSRAEEGPWGAVG